MAQNHTIKGRLVDKITNESLMYANCALYSAKDTITPIKGIASDTNGNFLFTNVKKMDLRLVFSFVGYKKLVLDFKSSELESNQIDIGTIKLELDDLGLKEVEVVAMKDRIKLDADKMTLNVDPTTAQSVTNAFELLKKTPGIAIDNEDNLKLNGKSGVLFQFGGRDMKLPWKSLVQILKATPATLIEKIEIMSNPSAKYDAEGVAGIINLIFKQDKNEGLSLSVGTNAHYSNELSLMGDININQVTKKFTNTLSFSASSWKQRMEQIQKRKIGFGSDSIFIKSNGENLYSSQDYTLNIGSDYQINKRNSIGINLTYSKSKTPNIDNPQNTIFSTLRNNILTDSLRYYNLSSSSSDMDNYIVNLNYQRKLDTLGGKLSADFDFIHNLSDNLSGSKTSYYNLLINQISPYKVETLNNTIKNSYNSYVFRTDYLKPFTKNLKMELGAKVSFTDVDNNFEAQLNDSNDFGRSNHFIYKENINALYGSLSNSFSEKTSLSLGLRMENANLEGKQQINDTSFKQFYIDIFPNLSFSHALNDINTFTFSYSMRISRPTYDNLNPFLTKTDDFSYQTGNPKLRPQYTHNFSLQHSFLYMLFSSLTYSYTKDVVSQMPIALPNSPIMYYMTQNISSSHNLNLSLSATIPIRSWWMSIIYLNGNYSQTTSKEPSLDINNKALSFVGYTSQNFTLPKQYKAEISGVYVSPGIWGVYKFNGFYGVNLNFSKTFFKEMLTVNLGVQNLFTSREQGGSMDMKNAMFELTHKADFTTINVGLRFNFGQNLNLNKNERKDAFEQRASGKREGGGVGGGLGM